MASLIVQDAKESSRARLLQLARAHARKQAADDLKTAKAQTRQIEVFQKKFRAALNKEIDRHPGGRAARKEIDQATKAVEALRQERAKKHDALKKQLEALGKTLDGIEKEHRAMLHRAAIRVFRRDQYVALMLRALKRHGRIRLKEGKFGALRMRFIPTWAELHLPILRLRPQTSFVIEAPFDPDATVRETFTALIGVSTGDAFADPGSGSVDISTGAADAGYQMQRAQLGAFLTLPSGFTTLKLQARITHVDASVFVLALGASWASCGGIAEVTSTADSTTIRRETSINSVIAPLLFYATDDFQGTHIINAEFPISNQGGEVLVNAGLKCDTWSAGVAAASVTAGGTVSKLTVQIS
jgi:hypothetical protein